MKVAKWLQLVICVAGLQAVSAQAGSMSDLKQGLDGLCGKLQQCAREELKRSLGNQELPKAMAEQIKQSIDGMCKDMSKQYSEEKFVHNPAWIDPAIACLKVMANTSCDEWESASESPACKKLEKITGGQLAE